MLSGLFVQVAHADEIRHTTFPNVMLGTWAETAEQCAAKDKTNLMERANRRKAYAPRTETRLAAKQSGVLPLPDAQRCLSGGFQGINHKCGPVFIEPSALNHFTPFWRFEKLGCGH
jgi:hypothetical protein